MNAPVRVKPSRTRHLLVQQDEVVRLAAQEFERIVGIRGQLDRIALFVEQQPMRLQ
jgi:hypothetical protein